MNKNMTVLGLIASCLFVGKAFCADWKYYGEFTTAPDIEQVLFFDSNSTINTNDSIKVWVKILSSVDIKKSLENKLIIDKVTQKIAAGYNPPITKINPKVTNAVYLEGAANDPSVKSKAEILYQLACAEKKFRKISGMAADQNGVLNQRFGISKWEEIAPESNAENLSKILCASK